MKQQSYNYNGSFSATAEPEAMSLRLIPLANIQTTLSGAPKNDSKGSSLSPLYNGLHGLC